MDFSWLEEYGPLLLAGLLRTLELMALSGLLGFALAVPVALAQVSGGFTTTIRGTPLLVQIYLL